MNAAIAATSSLPLRAQHVLWFCVAAGLLTAWRMTAVTQLGFTLFYDEAQYWDWSRDLAWGYYSKPPMIAALIAAGTSLFGHSLLAVKAVPMLLYPLTAAVVGALAHDLKPGAGVPAAWLVLCIPLTGFLGLFASTDAPLLLCWATAAWSVWRAQTTDDLRWWLALGLATGVGLLSKYTMAAFLVSALPVLWLVPGPRRGLRRAGPWLALGVAGLVFSPNVAWNAAHHFPTWQHTAAITTGAASSHDWRQAWEFLAGQALLLGPLGAWWAMRGLSGRWRRQLANSARPASGAEVRSDHAAWLFVLVLSWPLLTLACVQAWLAHAHLNWAAPAHIGTSLAAALALSSQHGMRNYPRALAWTVALNLALSAVVMHANRIYPAFTGQPLPSRLDVFARMRGWDQAFAQARQRVQAHHPGWLSQGRTPQPIVLAQERVVLTQAAYQWRDLNIRPIAWNADGQVQDHYELTTRLAPAPGQAVLLLSVQPQPRDILSRFETVQRLADIRVEAISGRFIELHAFAVSGFIGYPPMAPTNRPLTP